jgi:hypothetical protein
MNMVQGQIFRRMAVLALVVIPLKNVVSVKYYASIPERAVHIPIQSDDGWHGKSVSDRPKFYSSIFGNHFCLVHEYQQKSLWYAANGKCSKILIEYKHFSGHEEKLN